MHRRNDHKFAQLLVWNLRNSFSPRCKSCTVRLYISVHDRFGLLTGNPAGGKGGRGGKWVPSSFLNNITIKQDSRALHRYVLSYSFSITKRKTNETSVVSEIG